MFISAILELVQSCRVVAQELPFCVSRNLERFNLTGCFPLSWSLDQIGIITRTVRDCAIIFALLSGKNGPIEVVTDTSRTIGIPTSYYTDHLEPTVTEAFEQAAETLRKAGHRVVDVPVIEAEEMRSLNRAIMRAEAASVHADLIAAHPHHYDLPVRKFLTSGEGVFAVDYIDALRARAPLLRRAMETTFSRCDLLLTPTVPSVALRYDEIRDAANAEVWRRITRLAHCTQPASYLRLPAMSVPFALSGEGLPIGIQLIAPPGCEGRIFSGALSLEAHWKELGAWPAYAP